MNGNIPPEAVALREEEKPHFGQRREDNDKLARLNASIARYRYIIGFAMLVLGLTGGRIIWPKDQFASLAEGQREIKAEAAATRDSVRNVRARLDTAEIVSSVFRFGMARFACLKSTPDQQDVLPWSCNRLRDTGELIYNSPVLKH